MCVSVLLLQCPHNVHKLDGYMCDSSQVGCVSAPRPPTCGRGRDPFNPARWSPAGPLLRRTVQDSRRPVQGVVGLRCVSLATFAGFCFVLYFLLSQFLSCVFFEPSQTQPTGFVTRSSTPRGRRRGTAVLLLMAEAGCSATSREFGTVEIILMI